MSRKTAALLLCAALLAPDGRAAAENINHAAYPQAGQTVPSAAFRGAAPLLLPDGDLSLPSNLLSSEMTVSEPVLPGQVHTLSMGHEAHYAAGPDSPNAALPAAIRIQAPIHAAINPTTYASAVHYVREESGNRTVSATLSSAWNTLNHNPAGAEEELRGIYDGAQPGASLESGAIPHGASMHAEGGLNLADGAVSEPAAKPAELPEPKKLFRVGHNLLRVAIAALPVVILDWSTKWLSLRFGTPDIHQMIHWQGWHWQVLAQSIKSFPGLFMAASLILAAALVPNYPKGPFARLNPLLRFLPWAMGVLAGAGIANGLEGLYFGKVTNPFLFMEMGSNFADHVIFWSNAVLLQLTAYVSFMYLWIKRGAAAARPFGGWTVGVVTALSVAVSSWLTIVASNIETIHTFRDFWDLVRMPGFLFLALFPFLVSWVPGLLILRWAKKLPK